MTEYDFTAEDLRVLKQWDTPTICNGLEVLLPERRAIGFTVESMVAAHPKLPPIVGLARTAIIRAKEKPAGSIPPRTDWYDYVAADNMPTIAVIQDADDRPGFGAFWGEVHSIIHRQLGVLGCVTNGSFRDLDVLAPEFQILGGRVVPSHAHVHVVQMRCDVNIFGMVTTHDQVIHADCHGAVVIPPDAVKRLPDAIELCVKREKAILDVVRSPDFNSRKLQEAFKLASEIH